MIPDKPATASVPIHELLARRWSPRAFDPKRPVSREQIISLLEAARWAPSRFGDEPYRFLVWDKSVDPDGWKRVFDCLAESNRPWVANAPLLILACASFLFRHNGKPSRWGPHDTGAASMALVLQAAAIGLAAHQMGGYNTDHARAAFRIPPEFTPMAMIAIGYQADADILKPLGGDYYQRELAPRTRQPLAEQFFAGTWGNGLTP